MGILAPAVVYPKLILESIWKQKQDWDDELHEESKIKFESWCKELQCLAAIEVPRYMKGNDYNEENSIMQIHVFNDASKCACSAYATVVFLRVLTGDKVSVQLMQTKARLAPLEGMTIKRLELMGCVIGARLSISINSSLSYTWNVFTGLTLLRRLRGSKGTMNGECLSETEYEKLSR